MIRQLNQLMQYVMLLIFTALTLTGCGGSGGGNTSGGAASGTVIGVVANNTDGQPVAGATVTVGSSTATTGTDGSYQLTGIAVTNRAVVNISANNYAPGSKATAVYAGNTSRVDAVLLPVAYTATIASLTTPQTVAVPSSAATVMLPANGLQTASGATPSGNITVSVTPIDPSSNPQIMPGDFTTNDSGQIESFGALDVSMRDASGAPLNLAAGTSSTIRIPVAAGSTPLPTMDMWYYNTTLGQWVNQGVMTLGGTPPNQYYEGNVTHFSSWNADQRLNTTCITGKVVDANGNPVGNARIDSEGQGYIGTSTAYSAADGSFSIKVKANASTILTAKTANALSNSEVVMAGAAGTACTPMINDLVLGSTTAGSARIKLSWGANPSDLDSHLTGPTAGSTTRFHVFYGNNGSLTAAPYASLDVDDTSSFGPEVITINRFIPGLYRYSVHHYSGSSTIPASPARVELTLNGVTRIFTPPAATTLAAGSVWVVMELNVDSSGNITVTPINTYTTASSYSVAAVISGKVPVKANW